MSRLLDALRGLLGTSAEADTTSDADAGDLFGMSTAYVTMAAELELEPSGEAALCFGDVDATDFADTVEAVESILAAGESETGTTFRRHTGSHGYEWVVLADDDPEDLVTSIHFAADTFIERGYGSRLLAAVFGFERADGTAAYWVYSFRRGAYYPFVPTDGRERDDRLESKLAAVVGGELDIEADERYWYPLWPADDGRHPWE